MERISRPETLRQGADIVAQVLRKAGYQAYFAGGCVRDGLLGQSPKDFDITTDATPEQVAKLFRRTIMVGAAFGVVKVVLGKDRDYEVATFRADGAYSDGRRPDEVAYSTTPKEDVERRDFTINALLMDPENDEVLDLVGGREDLAAQLIRAVGDPAVRFAEDRLRMLRAVRFAARFGFDIEPETMAAMKTHAAALTDVSVERISAELEGIFKSARPGLGFELMRGSGLLAPALPHLASADASRLDAVQDSLTRLPEVTSGLSTEDRTAVGWALTLDAADAKAADKPLRDMKLSREQLRSIKRLLDARPLLEAPADPKGADVMRLAADPEAAVFAAYQRARASDEAVAVFEAARADVEARPLPPRPLVTGNDLTGLGMKPGRHFKDLLDAVDVEVLERRITSKDEAIAFVKARAGI